VNNKRVTVFLEKSEKKKIKLFLSGDIEQQEKGPQLLLTKKNLTAIKISQ